MLWHLLALLVACIWGSTFVASKVLLNAGLNPAEIMCLRFILAWVLMLPLSLGRRKQRQRSAKDLLWDEFLFIILGLTGGSLYFLSENTAVKLTSATSTVALIVGTTPIVTALMNRMVHHDEHLSNRFLGGSLVAVIGVALVVFNGVFVLDDDPLVILLSFAAAVSWGFYSLVIRNVERRHSSITITRKVFFWGVITMLPTCIWNIVLRRIGIIAAGNYLYFNPVTSLIAAYLVLSERITWLAIIGCLLTIVGVYLCNHGSTKH